MMNLSPGSSVTEPAPPMAATPGIGPVIPAVGKLGGGTSGDGAVPLEISVIDAGQIAIDTELDAL